MRKTRSLLILTLTFIILSVISVKASSSEITRPFVPEFTLKYVDNSYDVPPTYGKDPYTEKTIIIQAGYHVQNMSIELTIKNQLFSTYKDENGNNINLWYNVSSKGHYGDYWQYYPNGYYFEATAREYDTFVFSLGTNNGSDYNNWILDGIIIAGQVDFQVQAFIGYQTTLKTTPTQFDPRTYDYYVYTGKASDWSNIQTISIPDGKVFPSTLPESLETQTSMPQQSSTKIGNSLGFDWLQIAVILLGVTVIALVFTLVLSIRRSTKHTQAVPNTLVAR
jgi:hypothetical protein